jgi:hypothetical protein
VFVRRGFEPPELSDLFALGVSIERFDADDDADFFHALRQLALLCSGPPDLMTLDNLDIIGFASIVEAPTLPRVLAPGVP